MLKVVVALEMEKLEQQPKYCLLNLKSAMSINILIIPNKSATFKIKIGVAILQNSFYCCANN